MCLWNITLLLTMLMTKNGILVQISKLLEVDRKIKNDT